MVESGPAPTGAGERGRGGFGRGFGGRGRGGERGRGGRGGRRPRGGDDEKEWVPATKLGRLVKDGKISSIEQVYLFSLPIKESQIVDYFMKDRLKDEVLKIHPVQKQTTAGQRTRFKAYVCVGDMDGHVGLGVKCSSEVATAIRGAITLAKLNLAPVRLGYWGSRLGKPHTVPMKVSGKTGSVMIRLVPAPRGTGLAAARAPKKMLEFAGVQDCYTQSRGHQRTLGNYAKATFEALRRTYSYLTPDLWTETKFLKSPYQEFTDYLAKTSKKVSAE